MNLFRLAIVTAITVAVDAAEPEVIKPGIPSAPPADAPPADALSAATAELTDFIVPFASDVRVGYSANLGRYHRSQAGGDSTDNRFVEHGIWASYVFALSSPGRTLSGLAEWRAEIALLLGHADVWNPNDSIGTLRTAALDLGIGPSWTITDDDTSRLEFEIMPFVGAGLSHYTNDYRSENSGFTGSSSVTATGPCLEYGIKVNLIWCWDNGWGAALHAGFVQRVSKLDGDSTTRWDNGAVIHGDYTSDDTLTGVRFGLFVAKRF